MHRRRTPRINFQRSDLADYPAPLYNGDLRGRTGIPEHGDDGSTSAASDGVLVVSPEYNGSIHFSRTPDWCSAPIRPERQGGIFAGRPAAVVASSPGPMGGHAGAFHRADILGYLGMYVIPQQLGVAGEHCDRRRSAPDRPSPAGHARGHRQCPDHGSWQAACLRSPALEHRAGTSAPREGSGRRLPGQAGTAEFRSSLDRTVHLLRSLRSDRGPAG
ncbi:MAG: NAD(P)H-dependent oxidoreductase [Rhodocyclaceae bacterium]